MINHQLNEINNLFDIRLRCSLEASEASEASESLELSDSLDFSSSDLLLAFCEATDVLV